MNARSSNGSPSSSRSHKPEREARRVGRPRSSESGQASLATLLNLVRNGTATTRQDLEKHSELGRAVVSDRLSTLMELGLIEEGRLGEATGGRAPRHVEFRADMAAVEVAVVDRTSIATGIADLQGRLLMEHHEAFDITSGGQQLVERLATLFKWMREERVENAPVWGIGLALPGPVAEEPSSGVRIPLLQGIRGWESYPFEEELIVRTGAPVWTRSGVQMMTAGEQYAGAGERKANVIFVKLGRTASAGVWANGQLLRGTEGAAGLVGHTRIGEDLLDSLIGSDAIAARGTEAAEAGQSPFLADAEEKTGEISAVDVIHGAQFGDRSCIEILSGCGRVLGEALAPTANLLNPDVIILGGPLAETGDTLLAAVREAVYRQAHPLVTRNLKIVNARLGATAGLIGAAFIVAEELFRPEFLKGWVLAATPLMHPEFRHQLEKVRASIENASEHAARSQRPTPVPPAGRPSAQE